MLFLKEIEKSKRILEENNLKLEQAHAAYKFKYKQQKLEQK